MKKFFKKLMWVLGVIMTLIVLFFIIYLVASRSMIKKMTPVETRQLTDDVFAVKDKYVNMYLVKDRDSYIAVDAGIKKGSLKDEFKKLDIDPDRVRAVLLTHSDGDHAGGISLFKNADIYLPKEEEQLINGETGRFLWFGNKIGTDKYKLMEAGTSRIGDVRVRLISTPGHTAGASCYLINDRYLFTGDAIRLYNGKMEPFPKLINKSARKARKSMKNLRELDGVQFIFTGHYGYTADYSQAVSSRH